MIWDVFLYVTGAIVLFVCYVAARFFWLTRPPVVYDVYQRRWRAERGLHDYRR